MEIDKILKDCIGHKVGLKYIPPDGNLKDIHGTLKDVSSETIHILHYDVFGNEEHLYLNRHGCTLISVSDFGEDFHGKDSNNRST